MTRQRRFEAADDFVATGRLAEIAMCACGHHTLSDGFRRKGRHEDDRKAAAGRNQLRLQFIPGYDRHLNVGDHACRVFTRRFQQEVGARPIGACLVAERTHEARERRANAFVVVHDCNHCGFGHWRTS